MAENLPHRTPATTPMQASVWEGEFPARVQTQFTVVPKSYLNQNFFETPLSLLSDFLRYLRDAEQFEMLTDLTAVDHPNEIARFEIVYILYSFKRNERVRVKTRATLDQAVPSAVMLYAAADWLEREVFDMFGIPFSGHPNLKRILMPEDWNGFPLRKEASITGMDNDWVHRNLHIESGQ